ncbi:hypothetical protein EW145_g1957 [Phellinidium pouzarii]|uniref:DUF7918 domain-containing protein n=1 Tax=Phellinidium pouzarii TaxID=167371 RepID=A0A4S4LCL7_9AGAM|nr:hypothetical protein EW145_g1957 [Phellinidium pouzarii]
MPRFSNCDIGIQIEDSGVLVEYGTHIVGSTVTSWIASESGKEFAILFCAEHFPSSLQLVIFIDGVELVNRGYDQRKMGKEIVCSGVSIDANTVKPFIFADIVFSDEASTFGATQLGDVGTIRVEILQVVFTESRDPTYYVPGMGNDPTQKRSRINGARGICLGEQKALRTKKMNSMPFDPSNPDPIVVFNYIYRPRAMLLAQGIIPTYVPKFVEDFSSATVSREEEKGEAIRRLKVGFILSEDHSDLLCTQMMNEQDQQEQVKRELKELEDLRRLRERQSEIEREIEALGGFE